MAIVQNTLIGRSSGRVGNAVFSQWKGRNVLKQKPEIVTNPRTALQQQQRSKFVTLMALGKSLRPALQLGFKEYANQMSWLNRFMSTNNGSGVLNFVAEYNVWETDLSKIVISEGSLNPTFIGIDSIDAGDIIDGVAMTNLTLSWPKIPVNNQSIDDRIVVVVMYNESTVYKLREVTRNGEAPYDPTKAFYTIKLNDRPYTAGTQIYIAAFFVSADGRIVSGNSVAMGV